MHKLSTAATKSSALPALHSVGLLNVLKSTFAGASVACLVRSALSSLRDENLCIIRAMNTMTFVASATASSSRSDESADMTRRATEAPANVLLSTLRRPTEWNAVRADDFVAAVENLCIFRA